jgi:hypothetical protein
MSYDSAVQQWIMSVTGYDNQHVFRSQQVGPRPEADHATYLNMAAQDADFSEVKKVETVPESDNYDVSYTAPGLLVYSVNIFAANGRELLSSLWKSRYLLVPRLALRSEGLVLRSTGDSNEVPTPGDTSWRRQFHRDFSFGIYTVDSEEIEKIYTYRLEGAWPETTDDVDPLEVIITN